MVKAGDFVGRREEVDAGRADRQPEDTMTGVAAPNASPGHPKKSGATRAPLNINCFEV